VLIATEVIFSLDIDRVWTLVIDDPMALELKIGQHEVENKYGK
jgi:hypothetical protein